MNKDPRKEIEQNENDKVEFDDKISLLEKEIKELRKQDKTSNYKEILKKKLEIAEIETEIIVIDEINSRKAAGIIEGQSIDKKENDVFMENKYLRNCYRANNDLETHRNNREILELKLRILQAEYPQNKMSSQEYSATVKQMQEEMKSLDYIIQDGEKSLNKNIEQYAKMGGKQGNNIDFSVPYVNILDEYENENIEQKNQEENYEIDDGKSFWQYDEDQFRTDMEYVCMDAVDDGIINSDSSREEVAKLVSDKTASIFSQGLNGDSKEVAELYAEIYSNEIAYSSVGCEDGRIFGESIENMEESILDEHGEIAASSQLMEVMKRDENSYVAVYSVFSKDGETERQYGVPFTRNSRNRKARSERN